ncbi:hypothetical protein C0991_009394 [Blastosporella zonata]|nr:hypothetical protein C0991_009394 [Blastosporella zonata]
MYRLRPPHLSRRPIVGLAGALAAVGTFFYSQRVIYADSSEEDPALVIYSILAQPGDIATPTAIFRPSSSSHGTAPVEILTDRALVNVQLAALSGFGTIDGKPGISRFDSNSLPSSGGWANMQIVSQSLHAALLGGLISVFSKYEPSPEHSEVGEMMSYTETLEDDGFDDAVVRTFKDTFLNVDRTIVHRPFESVTSPLPKSWIVASVGAALSGSSALVAFYDHEPRKLRVANTGNMRAVLGRKTKKDKYSVHVLSEDHTSDTAPGLTRAFGLGAYKWTHDVQERLHRDFMGDAPLDPAPLLTLTAEPTVTTIEVEPGDFMVMGTRGLWNSLTNEEVVGLVGLWVNRDMKSLGVDRDQSVDVIMPSELPAPVTKDNTVTYKRWGKEKRFTCVDNNAAQHLSRNALGGADIEWTATLLATHPPRSQQLRDDICVTVVFFDDTP